MEQSESKHIIVGWGLAGATLAWELYFNSTSFTVFDSTENHSTRTAAGIVNPIVFKRLTKSWQADTLMPFATSFYKKVAATLNETLIHPKNIFKVFASFEDENNWASKQNDIGFKPYLAPLENHQIKTVNAPFGYGEVKTFGNLDTNLFLDASKAFFKQNGVLFQHNFFDYTACNPIEKTHQNKLYKAIYFCEGVGVQQNPFFNYLPMKPTHGETLTIKTKAFVFKQILNKNMFIMHIKDDLFKVGATYNWSLNQPHTTPEGRDSLIEKLKAFTNFDFEVVDHQAGIRPTVKDRRPLIGEHPRYQQMYIFNGLGTKGVMIAPYYAHQLFQTIAGLGNLDNEVNIDRYKKYLH